MLEIADAQLKQAEQVAQEFELDLLILFGSQVTGQTHAESDYNVGYLGQQRLDLHDEDHLIIALVSLFDLRDKRFIHVVNLRRVTPLQRFAATKDTLVLFQSTPTTYASFRAVAFKEFIETKPLRQMKAERVGVTLKEFEQSKIKQFVE